MTLIADIGLTAEEHRLRGDYALAEGLARQAVASAEQAHALDPKRLAAALNGLGLVCKDLAKYNEARAAYRQALTLLEGAPGFNDDWIATIYHNLGGIEHASGNYAEGEPLARRGLAIRRQSGGDAESVAADMVALAAILDALGKEEEAEAMYVDALSIFEGATPANAGEIAVTLNGLGALHAKRGAYEEAEALLTRAVSLKEVHLGARHPDVAVTLNNLGFVYKRRGDVTRAATTYLAAVDILEQALGAKHPKAIACRANYVRCVADAGAASG